MSVTQSTGFAAHLSDVLANWVFFISDVVMGSGNRTFYWIGPFSNGDHPSSLMQLMRPSPPPIEEFAGERMSNGWCDNRCDSE